MRAEFAIDRGTDQDAQFHACIALIEQILGAEQLVLMPIHGNERRRSARALRVMCSAPMIRTDLAPAQYQTHQTPAAIGAAILYNHSLPVVSRRPERV